VLRKKEREKERERERKREREKDKQRDRGIASWDRIRQILLKQVGDQKCIQGRQLKGNIFSEELEVYNYE
jgi:hypothetical protein